MKGFADGFKGFLQALGFMLRNGMGWMFSVPLLLWVLLTFGSFSLLHGPVEALGERIAAVLGLRVDPVPDRGWWSLITHALNATREVLSWLVLKLLVLYLLLLVNKYVVMVLLSPLLALASERSEKLLTGAAPPFSLRRCLREALRGTLIALRNAFLELGIGALLLLCSLFVPVLVPLTTLMLFLVGAYFYGFSALDYVHERCGLSIGAGVAAVNAQRGLVLGNGVAFSLLMKVPLAGITFAPLMASVGAVLAMHRAGTLPPAAN